MGFTSTVLLLLWMRERLINREWFAIAECVTGFDHSAFDLISDVYNMVVITVSPKDLAIYLDVKSCGQVSASRGLP